MAKTPTLNTQEAAAYLKIKPVTIRSAISRGYGPLFVVEARKGSKTGATEKRFTKGNLKEWQRGKTRPGKRAA